MAGLEEYRAPELSEALARHSLVYLDSTQLGPRTRMLETVREFVAERLAARPDADQVGRRHAGYYLALAEQADRPLRGSGPGVWLERLDAEAGNLAAAVRWYLAHDPGPLPHLFRVLWLFWLQRDLESQASSWVEQFRHAAGPLDVQARVPASGTAIQWNAVDIYRPHQRRVGRGRHRRDHEPARRVQPAVARLSYRPGGLNRGSARRHERFRHARRRMANVMDATSHP